MARNRLAGTRMALVVGVLQAVVALGCASQIFLDDQRSPDSQACDVARTAASSSNQVRQPDVGRAACISP
jgi:hypothetical protein